MINDTKEAINKFLFINKKWEDLTSYDLVIILGNNFYKENAETIKRLYEKGKINDKTKIIISGNKGFLNQEIETTEAEIIEQKIKELNLNINCILEKKAKNIKENLDYSKRLIANFQDYNRILLIGKAFVSRRILMTSDALGYPLNKIDIYGLEVDITKENWTKETNYRKRILEELERIGKYTIKGDLKI